MSITPIQYLLLDNLSVCYLPHYIANVFFEQKIAKVTEIRTHYNDDISILHEKPEVWYKECTQTVLLRVEWFNTEAAYRFIQSVRNTGMFKQIIYYQEQHDNAIPTYITPDMSIQPWAVYEANLQRFCEIYHRHIIWVNPVFKDNVQEEHDANDEDQNEHSDEDQNEHSDEDQEPDEDDDLSIAADLLFMHESHC
jgi:hypothetical protein